MTLPITIPVKPWNERWLNLIDSENCDARRDIPLPGVIFNLKLKC